MSGYGAPQLSLPKFTPAVKAILIVCGAMYVIELVVINWIGLLAMIEELALFPEKVTGWPPHLWQLFTYLWLHHPNDPSHLLFNMLGLWLVGALLEQRWGTRPFLKFYLLTGLFAGLTVVAVGEMLGSNTPVLGASGAVDGLMIAFGILYPNLPIYFFGVLPLKGKHFVLILVGLNVLYAAARLDGVSVSAHFGGMAAGALLVTGLWRPSRLRLKLFGPPKARPPRRPAHLKVVPDDDEDDGAPGGNGKGRMLH